MMPPLLVAALGGVLAVATATAASGAFRVPPKSYVCVDGVCQMQDPTQGQTGGSVHSTCLMTCGKGMLWPYPTGKVELASDVTHFPSVNAIRFVPDADAHAHTSYTALLARMEGFFRDEVQKVGWGSVHQGSGELEVRIVVQDRSVLQPAPGCDEAYTMKASTSASLTMVHISAQTVFGARHALETLSQLVAFDEQQRSLAVVSAFFVDDRPAFRHRGVMIDVSRNFISMDKLRENLRAASYNKMNVLHLHLSDTASFPVPLRSQPNVTAFGAYSDEQQYRAEDLAALVAEAQARGVLLLPEVDAPAHMSAGWQWGAAAGLGELVLCADPYGQRGTQWAADSLEPPSGQLNLANPHALRVLGDIYRDVVQHFGAPAVYHLGGDEVIVGSDESWAACYNSSALAAPLLAELAAHNFSRADPATFYGLWLNFTLQAAALVADGYRAGGGAAPERLLLWGGGGSDESGVVYNLLTLPDLAQRLPPSRFSFQIWDTLAESVAPSLLAQGYEVLLSHTDYAYLDCGNAGPSSAGGYWCQPYHEWYHLYEYTADAQAAWALTPEQRARVLGAEALIWTEMVDDQSVSQKLWPRAAALAEATWSDPRGGWFAAADRMLQWRARLVQRGVAAEALQPHWCQQRGGVCSQDAGTPQ